MTKIVLPVLLAMFCNFSLAQHSGSLTGKVTDKQSSEALPGATVLIKGTSISAVTDNEGRFNFQKIDIGMITLVVSYVGYRTIEVNVEIVL